MDIFQEFQYKKLQYETRRHFLKKCTSGLGSIALGSLMGCGLSASEQMAYEPTESAADVTGPKLPHFVPRAKRIIYMHMSGGPSQLEMFDYKPELVKLHGLDCPASLLEGKKFAFIQGTPKMLGPQAQFSQYGESGTMVSNLLPHFSSIVDDVAVIKSMHTDISVH